MGVLQDGGFFMIAVMEILMMIVIKEVNRPVCGRVREHTRARNLRTRQGRHRAGRQCRLRWDGIG
ncbi:hypothetical protein CS379_17675 [Methylobacterium frigidaeris]|nr:hypothetical protein CS379_17675 [Methylobacterium frigidaeris]